LVSKPTYTVWLQRGNTELILNSAVGARLYKVLSNAELRAAEMSRQVGVVAVRVREGRWMTDPVIATYVGGEKEPLK
jgi:hypothetical protein